MQSDDKNKVIFLAGHPHEGEVGIATGEVIKTHGGTRMVRFKLVNCQHGVEECYAAAGSVRLYAEAVKR